MTPDSPLADTLMRLRRGSPGKAMCTRELVENRDWETVWVIYDDTQHLAGIGSEPVVEIRAGAFDEGGVLVLAILLRVGGSESGRIYDTWINAQQIEGENVYLQDLARQDYLRLHLCDEQGHLEGTLTAPNRLQHFSQVVLERQATYQPSTRAAFEYARDKVCDSYTDVRDLWDSLEKADLSL